MIIIQIIFIHSYFETDALFYYKFAQSILTKKLGSSGVGKHLIYVFAVQNYD